MGHENLFLSLSLVVTVVVAVVEAFVGSKEELGFPSLTCLSLVLPLFPILVCSKFAAVLEAIAAAAEAAAAALSFRANVAAASISPPSKGLPAAPCSTAADGGGADLLFLP